MISGGNAGCPDPSRWLAVAGGSERPEESARLAAHAAGCPDCAQELRQAIQIMDDESSVEEAEMAKSLTSAHPEWQRSMARRLAAGPRRLTAARRAWFPLAIAAALAVTVSVAIWIAARENRPPLDELARAYAEDRSIELRIPGAPYAPLRISRGTGSGRSAELLESEARIERKLPSHAGDSGWLHARGRAELLDPVSEASIAEAIRDLHLAVDVSKSASGREYAEVLVDLATAYYQRAVTQHRPIDYSAAIEYLTQAIQADPSLAVAYFNRALVLEKKLDYLRARDDWKKYLSTEPSGRWSDEAREHLRSLDKTIGAIRPQDSDRLAGLAEHQLQSAMESGFRNPPDASRLAMRMESENQDLWLHDAIQYGQHAVVKVLAPLVRSRSYLRVSEYPSEQARLEAAGTGRLPAPLLVWLTYESLFRRVHSPSERLEPEGLDLVVDLARAHRYCWFWGQLVLDRSSSDAARGDWARAAKAAAEVREMAHEHNLPLLEMRAAAFLENEAANTGRYREAASLEQEELAQFWQKPNRWLSAESFFAGMAWCEEALGRPGAASLSAESAAQTAEFAGALETEAVNLSRAAAFSESEGNSRRALPLLQRSQAIFATLTRNPATDDYRAFAEAEYASASGTPALSADMERSAAGSSSFFARVTCLRALALMDARMGDLKNAEERLRGALAVLGASGNLSGPAVTRRWRLEVSRVYRQLTETLIRENRLQDAFRVWQDFLRADSLLLGSTWPAADAHLPHSQTSITFAHLDGKYAIWRRDGGRLDFTWSRPSAEVDQLARGYFSLCSWASSREEDVLSVGRELVRALGPIVADAPSGRELIIQPDGELTRIPWSSLPVSDGTILADRAIPVVWPLPLDQVPGNPPRSMARALVVGADFLSPSRAGEVRPLPALDDELAAAASLAPDSIVLRGPVATVSNIERDLARASVLHFAGHALSSPDGASLIVAPDPAARDENSDLWHPSRDLCRRLSLAVFSACSTAKYEEVDTVAPQNLAHEFLLAGTPQVVAALWNVDSKATMKFMTELYRELRSGSSTASAARNATAIVRSGEGWQHPFFWAAFTFFGR